MTTSFRRWQDYATMLLGIILAASPLVFGQTGQSTATLTAYILGALVFLSGILTAAIERPNGALVIPAILGVVTFVAPWVLGFSGVAGVAWVAWIVGVLTFLNAVQMYYSVTQSRRPSAA